MILYERSYTETNINLFVRLIFVLMLFKQGHLHPPSLHAINAGAARPSCRRFELLLGPDNLRFKGSEKNGGKVCCILVEEFALFVVCDICGHLEEISERK
jgi:hypothetical protein